MVERRKSFNSFFVGNSEVQAALGKTRRKQEYNINMNLKETVWEVVD
jgi:hypothetical protein